MAHRRKASITASGIPTSVVPQFIGQVYFDEYNDETYISYGTNAGEWQKYYSADYIDTAISGTLQEQVNITASGTSIIRVSTGDLLLVSNRPTLAQQGVVGVLNFPDNSDRYAYGAIEIPNNYKTYTNITLEIHYFNDLVQTGIKNCVWKISYKAFNEGDTVGSITQTSLSVTDTLPSGAAVGTYNIANITLAYNDSNNPLSEGKQIYFEFLREASNINDTMDGDSALTLLIFRYVPEVSA